MEKDRDRLLDGLRGIAIALVMLTHFFWMQEGEGLAIKLLARFIDSMWLGVDLFFVLSGYLITGILIGEREKQGYFRRFYIRRAFRIWPAYYVVFLLIWAFASMPLVDGQSQDSRWSL